jgi:hypothetical protein
MAAWVFLPLALLSSALEPNDALTVVWHDSQHLFLEAGVPRLAEEMEKLFLENGLFVRFHAASENEDLKNIPDPRMNAILLPDAAPGVGLPAHAMAAATGQRGKKYSIFVSYTGVRRALGQKESVGSPRELVELSRALARVVAHEVVHALAPERGHAEWGLMAATLNREALLADAVVLDGMSRDRAGAALVRWAHLSRRGKLSVRAETSRSIVPPEVPPCPSAN